MEDRFEDDRFIIVYYQRPKALGDNFKVIVDSHTGVNYLQLLLVGGGGTSITPLYDENGNVLISSKEEIEEFKKINTL